MATREELLARLRADNSPSSGSGEDSSYDAGESSVSESASGEERLSQLREGRERQRQSRGDTTSDASSSSSCSTSCSSSSDGTRMRTQLERQRQLSSDAERHTTGELRSSAPQSPNCLTRLGTPQAAPPAVVSDSSSSGCAIPQRRAHRRGPAGSQIRDLFTPSVEESEAEGRQDEAPAQLMTGQDEDSESPDENSFDYRNKPPALSKKEMMSLVFHDIAITHHVPRIAVQSFASLHDPDAPLDPRTTKNRLAALTGVEEVRYDCCIEGCISYALPKYANLEKCPIKACGSARFKANGMPYAQHTYIPVIHRLRLMYSDKERAIEMMTYRNKMNQETKTGVRSDFWSGEFFRDLMQQGLFPEMTDIALSLSTDGVKMNLNLPPSIRSKRRNMLLVGFTPGPNNPKDLDSFLWPLVEEMLQAHQGIKMVWNAALGEYFTLHAYITIVTADMPGREKLMRMKGNRAYRYCNYCHCRGVRSTAVYCPFSFPLDAPGRIDKGDWRNYDREHLPMRDNDKFREDASHIEETGHQEAAKLTGIAGLAILAQLPSIDFPRSFPPDSMHLFFENVIPSLTRHYRGVFFKSDYGARTGGDNYEALPRLGGSRKRKQTTVSSDSTSDVRPATATGKNTRGGPKLTNSSNQPSQTTKQKFRKTQDRWNVEPKVWEEIGLDQKASISLFPAAFGRAPRNFFKHCHEFSGEEWKQQATIFLPIYLSMVLEEEHYNAFCNLVETIGQATQTEVTLEDIEEVRSGMVGFSEFYEREFYKRRWNLLPACLPVFHQLLHVADALAWIGPMHVYSQWSMERMCGMITRTAKSRVSANRNMELTLLLTEQKHMLGYALNGVDWPIEAGHRSTPGDVSISSAESDDGTEPDTGGIEDEDGNLSLLKAFRHRLSVSRPEPVRVSIGMSQQPFRFTGMVRCRPPDSMERQKIREYMAGLNNYNREYMSPPTDIYIWRWCRFRERHDNKKEDFKVTSRNHKRSNNTRNSSVVAYRDAGSQRAYGEVQFFFQARLPSELGSIGDSGSESGSDGDETTLHSLAYIRKIAFECEDRLVRRRKNSGGLAVISVESIESLVGRLKVGSNEYLTTRFTSMLGRVG